MKKARWIFVVAALLLFATVAFGTTIKDDMTFEGPVTFSNTVNSGANMTVTPSATGYLNVLTGNLKVGNGTPDTTLNGEDAYIEGTLEVDGVARFDATTMTIRGVTYTLPAADGGASTFLSTNGSGALTWAAGAGVGTLDQAYDTGGAGAGAVITVDQAAVQLNGSHATNDTFFVNKTAGTGDAIQVTNAGTGKDINGTSGLWSVDKTGLGAFTGVTVTGAAANVNASSNFATNINTGTSTGAVAVGGGTNTVAVNSSSWDITTAGAVSGVTTIGMSGDLTNSGGDLILSNGKAVKGSTTTAETVKIQAYDVDNTTYRDAITLTNGNTVGIAIGSNNETVAINSADWDINATGDMTGIGAITADGTLTINTATAITLYNNEAVTIGHATNGAADDLTIALTGATDSSIILSSAGTGEDAIALQSSAGGVDIDAAAAKDVNIAGGQVALVSKDDAASAIALTANIGTSETIVVTNTQGTSESAITLVANAGGVNVDAAAAKDLDLAGGQVKLVSKDNAAGAISLTANIGANETITVTNTQGTGEGAIALTSTAGGVDIDAAATKNIDLSGGQVLISSKDNAASAVAITANVGSSETIVVTNTQGTDAAAINLTATAGGITAAVADTKAITLNGTTNFKVGSNIASPAGGELDLGAGTYFYITGTNNITSIAAADSTAGRFLVLRFADVLTFTDGNNLKLAGNLATTADDTITLMCDGTNWYEMARSAN